MPDGDIVHNRLPTRYQKPYKWLCEGKASSNECARAVLDPLKKDLKQKGDLPIQLCRDLDHFLSQAVTTPDYNSVNWAALNRDIEQLVYRSKGRIDVKELFLRAAKSFTHDLRYSRELAVGNTALVIIERYIDEVYRSEFQERVPLTLEHYSGIDKDTLSERIERAEEHIKAGIRKFAKDAINKQSMAKLSLHRRSSRKAIDLDEDLLAG